MDLFIRFIVLVLIAGNVCAATAPSPRAEEVRLLEYVLDDVVLSDAVAAYGGPANGTLLPLGASMQLIGIAITVDAELGKAHGFVVDEKRPFQLDIERGIVSVGGKARRFHRELVRVYHDDIYVDSTLLGDWLPVTFDVELFALRVRVRPREPLPLQKRLDRERRIRHWRLRLSPERGEYRPVSASYRLFDAPSIDQTVRLSFGPDQFLSSYASYATGDFLYMESEAYLSGNDANPFEQWRLTLRRRDAAGSIGGPLRATEFALGHISHATSALLSTATDAAPGVVLTNVELYRATEFDRHSLRGNLPPGWDVELYHNGTLIDYRQARPDGQYAFDDVPMLFGMNFFRLVFYGPQGQRREEEHRFLLGDSLTKPGRLEYRATANAASADEYRGSLFLSYGIGRHMTATAELAALPTPAGRRRFVKGGARMFWSALFVYGDYAADDAGGSAYEAGLQTRIAGVNVMASRTGVRDQFVSEALHTIGDRMITRDRVRIDMAIPASVLPRLAMTAEIERHQLASGAVRNVIQGRASTSHNGLSLSQRLLRTTMSGHAAQTEAGLQFSRNVRRVHVRGEVLYGMTPAKINSANLSIERPFGAGYRLFATVARSFLDGRHAFSVGVDKSSGSFAAGMEARLTAEGEPVGNINLSAGLGRDPHLGAWIASARSRAASGAASLRVFLDRNRNQQFDAGDQLLEGVAFTVNEIERSERTDANGVARIGDLSPHAAADVAIAMRTLEDPQWEPAVAGVRVIPRPGKVASIEIAVLTTVEVEGTVTRLRADGTGAEAAQALTIELVNSAGKVTQQTKTSYDGYYVVSKVHPGRYTVRVAAGANGRSSRTITVGANEGVITGVDLRLGAPAHKMHAPANATPVAATAATPERFVVQLGAFRIRANADALKHRIKQQTRIEHRLTLFFVEAGPFATRAEAVAARTVLARHGFDGVIRTAR